MPALSLRVPPAPSLCARDPLPVFCFFLRPIAFVTSAPIAIVPRLSDGCHGGQHSGSDAALLRIGRQPPEARLGTEPSRDPTPPEEADNQTAADEAAGRRVRDGAPW